MHWVDRGPPPLRLAAIRAHRLASWKAYGAGLRPMPTDTDWRQFRGDLSARFKGLCGYCERLSRGLVDHFRPKSQFPNEVYDWGNWVFACPDCNSVKWRHWPVQGFVDPCARVWIARPEQHIEVDVATGRVVPCQGLGPIRQRRAIDTIDLLQLNAVHHLKSRLEVIEFATSTLPVVPEVARQAFLDWVFEPGRQLSSTWEAIATVIWRG